MITLKRVYEYVLMIRANTDIPIKLMKVDQIITSPDVKGNLTIKLLKNKIVWYTKKIRNL